LKSSYLETSLFDQKVELATEGLEPYFLRHLRTKISHENASIIAEYISSMKVETNLSDNHRRNVITLLKLLSEFLNNKLYDQMTREDVLKYLQSLKKPYTTDASHKWVATYNHRVVAISRFFKWFYSPQVEATKRVRPSVVNNIPIIKRKEKSIYKPSDLWTEADHIVFLRYCQNKRDRCYHAMAIDTSCRPNELLKLKLKDIDFKSTGDRQYAEVLVNGKTGSRVIPLFNSIPYLKDWIEDHPQGRNLNAILFCGISKSKGRQLSRYAIYDIYEHYKKKVLPSLIKDPNVPQQDREQLSNLLKKPFNPYILRHSALTQKAIVLKEHVLRQHAGWTMNSKMPQIYVHWFGNESSNTLLELYGVTPKQNSIQELQPRHCPHCREPNKLDSKFCSKCKMVLTYNEYVQVLEKQKEKDEEMQKMKNDISIIKQGYKEFTELVKSPKNLFQILANE
jgi:integrase/recombinase XerD